MSSAASTPRNTSSKPLAPEWQFSISTTTAGPTFLSSMAPPSNPLPVKTRHQPPVPQQSRRHFHRRHRQIRPAKIRMGSRRVRRRLRQRWLGRFVRHLLRQKCSLPQQRRRHLLRCQRRSPASPAPAKLWGTGCAFVDYDRDGKLDLMVANYVDFDLSTAPAPGERASCIWKGVPVMCGPRGLPWTKNTLLSQFRKWKIRGRHHQSAHRPDHRPLQFQRFHSGFRRRRLARHLRRLRQHSQHPLSQQSRRHFHRRRRHLRRGLQ